ncbi:hypothetical protein Pmani_008711 [Petrolisthes manimaculis]|uniref:MADF domain-containing protein n=1 Tax=Petrolisthes manimaculis TaxID=1843537 RepID=A0AAE1UEC6_9EUCA|nr:hypothetical protein Pmani_008711 [Petrolisthes manimaculis]
MKTESDDDEDWPRKKSKISCQLSPKQEEELVEWFSAHPIFYDRSERDFNKNKGKREVLLEGKAKEMGITGMVIWTWFKSMRTIYGKLKKQKFGQVKKPLTSRAKWTIDSFQFLETHLVRRLKTKHMDKVTDHNYEKVHDEDSESEVSDSSSLQQRHIQPSTSHQGIRRGSTGTTGTVSRVEEPIIELIDPLSTVTTVQEDMQSVGVRTNNNNRMAFCQWMGQEANKFNEQLWTKFMSDAFALVMKYRQLHHHH